MKPSNREEGGVFTLSGFVASLDHHLTILESQMPLNNPFLAKIMVNTNCYTVSRCCDDMVIATGVDQLPKVAFICGASIYLDSSKTVKG